MQQKGYGSNLAGIVKSGCIKQHQTIAIKFMEKILHLAGIKNDNPSKQEILNKIR